HEKDTERVARGLKASIHNPRVSQEAKIHAEERLHEMGIEIGTKSVMKTTGEKDPIRVAAGYKATLHNPGISEETKDRAEEHLKEMGAEYERENRTADGMHYHYCENRELGGYKATLKNPRVSDAAKDNARRVLTEHGVEVDE
ncbi:hypothetical protein AMATHDRAFT_137573, partial [Amanita thiersii Skay4041]